MLLLITCLRPDLLGMAHDCELSIAAGACFEDVVLNSDILQNMVGRTLQANTKRGSCRESEKKKRNIFIDVCVFISGLLPRE